MKKMQRGLALLLALVLVAGLLPVRAEAAAPTVSGDGFTLTLVSMKWDGQEQNNEKFSAGAMLSVKNNGGGSYTATLRGSVYNDNNFGPAFVANGEQFSFQWEKCTVALDEEASIIGKMYNNTPFELYFRITKAKFDTHSTEEVTVKNPTCSAKGEKKTVCKNCTHVLSTDAIPVDASAHKYVWTNDGVNHTGVCEHNSAHTISGTCAGGTATCVAKAVCDTCKLAYGNTVDHSWTQWKYDTSAFVNFSHYRTCTVCNPQGNKYTVPGYELAPHDYKNATCTKQGECECGSKGDYAAHSVTYTQKDDTTIKQGCENCSFEATVSLAVDDSVSRVYTGEEIKALKPVTSSNWQGAAPEITYTKNVEVGTATGTIVLGDASISKTFEITAADMVLDVKDYEGTYDGAEHGISIVGAPAEATITYSATEDGPASDTINKQKNVGETTVYYKVEADNYNPVSGHATIKINAADMALTVTGYEGVYDGTEHGISIVGAPDGAKITYRETENISYGDTEITLKNAGTKKVYYKVSAPNYNDVEGSATITINPKEVTVVAGIAIGDYSKFGDNAKIEYGDAVPTYIYKYDGLASGELANEVITGGTMVTCDYKQGDAAGEYVLEVDISALSAKNYTFKTENGKLTVEPRELEIEWGETEFTYDEESHIPTATVKNAVGEDEITLSITGAKTNANTESVPKYTATIEGFSVKGGNKANYKLPEENTKEFEIKAAAQEAPTELEAEKETILNKGDGKITGVTTAMEYRKEGETAYTAVSGTTITNLTSGKYFVRYKAKTNYAASPDTEVTVEAEKSLKVTVPATQEGYTLTADKIVYGYNDDPVLTLTVAEGYIMTADFVMTVTIDENETEIKQANLTYDSTAEKYSYTITDLQKDAAVTVEGIEDTTKPAVKVTLGSVDYTTLMDKASVKFEDFMGIGTKVKATVTTTGGSDVTILYLESEAAKTKAELDAIENEKWDTYTADVVPSGDGNKIFYFKAVDKAGNESDYVSTKGFIYDGTAPSLSLGTGTKTFGITRRVTVYDKNLDSILINENPQEVKERTTITYRMTRDTEDDKAMTYKFEVTDKAGNKSEGTYTIEPMKFLEKGTSWSKGSTKTLDFKVNTVLGDYADVDDYDMQFQVKIDSKAIDAKNYTVQVAEDGSGTFIKLKADYLKGLKVAKHKIQVSVVANKASGTGTETLDSTDTVEFSVSDNPKTGDGMNMALWGGMAVLSLMAAAVLVLGKKRFDAR